MKEIDHCYEEPNTARSDDPILNETNEGIYSNEAGMMSKLIISDPNNLLNDNIIT